jgi:hypothetical protein
MSDQKYRRDLAKWKERARETLRNFSSAVARKQGLTIDPAIMRRRDSPFLRNAVLVTDPINLTLQDSYSGTFTCTYDIGQTLSGMSRSIQKTEEDFTDAEVLEFAEMEKISIDEAMFRIALRYVEAEVFFRLKAGGFLHRELKPALEQMIKELIDDAYLQAAREYGIELVEASKTLERSGRDNIRLRKRRSGFVRNPGRPISQSTEELITKIQAAMLLQKGTPTLSGIAKTLNYGSFRGGASALGKLLKRHSIDWKKLRKDWIESQKRK